MTYAKEIEDEFRKSPAFTMNDVKKIIHERTSNAYLKLLLYNLVKKGRLNRITKSTYTYNEDVEAVGFAFRPFYYGLQEALSLRNLWEQETNPVIITPKKVRTGTRAFLGRNYVIKRITRSKFFGFELIKYYDFWIPVSDIEKTLIDFVDFGEKISEETLSEIKKKIKKDVLDEYLAKYPKSIGKKVRKLLEQ